MTNLKEKAINSVIWSSIERISVQLIQFAIGILLARLLTPADFGLIAMIYVFIAIAQTFIDCGFSNALMQNKDRNEKDYFTAFYSNLFIALICYIIIFLGSPFIAQFYEEARLTLLLRILGINLVINALFLVHRTILIINLRFKPIAIIALISIIIGGGVGVYMAFKGYGVWALVGQYLLSSIASMICYWFITRWRPLLQFSMESFKRLFGFGSKLLFAGLLHTVYSNMYSLIIGKKFKATDLGYFTRGQTMAYLVPQNFTSIITQSLYPVLCNLQEDPIKLKSAFLAYVRMAAFITFPVVLIIAAVAEPLVSLLLTDKWLPCVIFIQILSIGYIWDPIQRINANSLSVKGRSKYVLYSEIIKKGAGILILVISLAFNLKIICIGLAAYSIVDVFISSFFTKRVIDVNFIDEIKAVLPFLIASGVSSLIAWYIQGMCDSKWLSLIFAGSIALGIYILFAYILKWKELRDISTALKKFLHK